MTRSRALDGNVPNPLAATYYVQRASAGLMITEGTQVSPQGVGYIRTPGIHSPEQVAGWKQHHRRRASRRRHDLRAALARRPRLASGFPRRRAAGRALGAAGRRRSLHQQRQGQDPDAARARDQRDPGIVEQFRKGAENAKAAGFDGVELHGANGYLLDQFLRDGSNHRTDAYGGSLDQARAVAARSRRGGRRCLRRQPRRLQALALLPGLLDVRFQSGRDLLAYREGARQARARLSARRRKRSPGR